MTKEADDDDMMCDDWVNLQVERYKLHILPGGSVTTILVTSSVVISNLILSKAECKISELSSTQ